MQLKTPDGQTVVVVGGSVPADHDGWMWDLTVPGNNDHDFYVVVTATEGLVQNGRPRTMDAGGHGVLVRDRGEEKWMDASMLLSRFLHIKDEVAKGNMSHIATTGSQIS